MPHRTSQHGHTWYRLDNAAKIYPVIMHSRHGANFRMSVLLREVVDPELLQQALEIALPRFPFFAVRLRRGLFWYYLETFAGRPLIEPDVINPMRPFSRKDLKKFLFRVRYYNRRVSVEFFHSVTDGTGALTFLKTLIATYLDLKGTPCSKGEGVLDVHQPAEPEEMEDAYKRFSNFRAVRRPKEPKAFRLQGTISPTHHVQIINGIVSLAKVKEAAKKYQISVTEFLAGVYLNELYVVQQQGGFNTMAPVCLSIPINVRRFYPSRTLRNFSLFVNPAIEPALGHYTLEEILGLVHHYMRYTVNEKFLNALMSANVGPERSIFLRFSPLFLKNLVMRVAYNLVGDSRFTSTMSNIGAIKMPEGMAEHVERFEFLIGPSHFNAINSTVCSTGDTLMISFTSTMPETDLQRLFFKQLVHLGVPVRIESNLTY